MIRAIALSSTLFLCLCFVSLAHAGQARVASMSGKVTVESDSAASRSLRVGSVLSPGSVIVTGDKSNATLHLDNKSVIDVFPNSRLELTDTLLETKEQPLFSLFVGYIMLKIQNMLAKELVQTPTTTLGVRGTKFSVSVAEDGASVVSVGEGRVAVATQALETTGAEVEIKAGQQVTVETESARLKPEKRVLKGWDDYKLFRRQQAEKMLPRLPNMSKNMNMAVDKQLAAMDVFLLRVKKHAKKIEALKTKLRSAKKQRMLRKQKLELRQQLTFEVSLLTKILFRARRTRMQQKSIFYRTQMIVNNMPKYKERIGADYAGILKELKAVLARKDEIKQRRKAIKQEIRKTLQPVRGALRKSAAGQQLRKIKKTRKAQTQQSQAYN